MESKDLKPWFRDELMGVLMGINLASRASMTMNQHSEEFRKGYLIALASFALVIGVSPDRIFLSEDLRFLNESHGTEKGL